MIEIPNNVIEAAISAYWEERNPNKRMGVALRAAFEEIGLKEEIRHHSFTVRDCAGCTIRNLERKREDDVRELRDALNELGREEGELRVEREEMLDLLQRLEQAFTATSLRLEAIPLRHNATHGEVVSFLRRHGRLS